MNLPFLFMSGESRVSTTLAFSNSKWDHTTVPSKLVPSEYVTNRLRRSNRPREVISGLIHYADVSDKSIEIDNLKMIIDKKISCWPNPKVLLKMTDRHKVLEECKAYGLVDHEIYQSDEFVYQIEFPFVLKVGTEHRGIGKHLIQSVKDIPEWEGIATMEPFFEGESVRVLIIGNDTFSFKVTNETSWIKNGPGADIEKVSVSDELVEHAKNAARYFGLDIAGVDYIVEKDGTPHFLEINQYPGLGLFDDMEECARSFLKDRMYDVQMGVR